jgi:propanol-preferring alcohol dehydrogenase
MIGFTLDGGFAEFLAAPEANLVSIPDDVSFDTAATLACSGMTAVHAVRRAGIGLGDLVVVNGIGGVGLMVINVATLAGASVVAIGDHHDKLRMAEDAGASTTLLVEDDYSDLGPRLHEMSIGQPIAVFETVGSAQSIQAGIRLLAADGSFVQIGYTSDHIDIHPSLLIRNELRIISSAAGSKRDLETAIALAGAGRLHARTTLVSGLGGLRPTLQAMRERRTLGRSVIVFEDRESD